MTTAEMTKPVLYNYACGCIQHTDRTWTLCDDCGQRIGKVGTCLTCDGPADEWWTIEGHNDIQCCSAECAQRELLHKLDDDQ